ncbi:MAG: CPBP family intramembrane metalloprotease [Rhodospirillaceae bacterium]|nr:CPBP family intramembrane metalloprotease [Rhodospirillaceae bacterium]
MTGSADAAVPARQYGLAFCVLALPFFLNDLAFIAVDGGYGVYLVDYGTRALVLAICLFWPLSRSIAGAAKEPVSDLWLAVQCIVFVPILGRLSYHFLEKTFVAFTGVSGLFGFPAIPDQTLYWLDLSVGLFAVALTEELVFRKFAARWLQAAGRSTIQIVLISAVLFALMHWGSGPGRLIYTFVGGVIYMTVYLKLGRLWPLVLAHWAENFLSFGPWDL